MKRAEGPHHSAHPETFTEAIAQGFHPVSSHTTTRSAPRFERLTRSLSTAARKDAGAAFSLEDQAAFKNAVVRLVAEGTYRGLVDHHMDMSHRMHGSMGTAGLHRFLGWHRRFLVAFEQELQRADAVLRPGNPGKLAIPYWRWQDPFPSWMDGFLPAMDPGTGCPPPPRRKAPPSNKPNAEDIDIILHRFGIQQVEVRGGNDYTKFTLGLEGYGLRPNGTELPAHNHGHAWIGGIMDRIKKSPTDPVFWLHHSQVDRLWEIWRQAHPDVAPPLTGQNRIMDPWAESYDDLLDIGALGYTYDSLAP